MLNYDFDLVASEPSDANTNSTTLFSDDTDDKSKRSIVPETGISGQQEQEVSVKKQYQNNATIYVCNGTVSQINKHVRPDKPCKRLIYAQTIF